MVKKQAPKEPIPANIKTDNMKNLSIIALLILMTGYSAAAASATGEGIRLLVKPYRIEDLSREIAAALG